MTPYRAFPVWVDGLSECKAVGSVQPCDIVRVLDVIFRGAKFMPRGMIWPCYYNNDGTGYPGDMSDGTGDGLMGDPLRGGGTSKRSRP
jgi:hypothetical protein